MEIVLIRHGKPTAASNPVVDACEYVKWIKRYNLSDVSKNSQPESINPSYKSIYSISSDLKRATHSANIYLDRCPEEIDKLYRELELPRYKLPFRLKVWNWLYLSRVLWVLGFKGSFESFNEAKCRAEIATNKLIKTAKKHEKVILFGHGYMNRYIRKSLIKKGWKLNCKSNAYWGVTSLEII